MAEERNGPRAWERGLMNYGHAFRIFRAARNLSQTELAERIGKGASLISLVEDGRRQPSLDTLRAVSRALRVPVYLIDGLAEGHAAGALAPEIGRVLLDACPRRRRAS